MSQHDQNIANADGATVRSDINDALAAMFSNSSGTSAPSTTVAHQLWADTSNGLLKKRNAANSGWIVIRTLDEAFVVARSSNTILGISDVGKTFIATSTFTQTLTAAATLADGWHAYYRNDGTGRITIDPNGAETIDGAATLILGPGESCRIDCNGTTFKTTGKTRAKVVVGTTTHDISVTGSHAVTGLGFRPSLVILWGATTAAGVMGMAAFDGTTTGGFTDNNANVSGGYTGGGSALVLQTSASAFATAVGASLDDDGFTLTWAKTSTPTGTASITYIALR